MSIIGSNILAGASGQVGGGYTIENSLRFRSSASAYLNRTFGSGGNLKTYTISFWIKRGKLGAQQFAFTGFNGSINGSIQFTSSDTFEFNVDGGVNYRLTTTQVFRDPSAWYHVVCVADTTQATSSNRLKIYVNGVQVTSFGTATYPTLNYDTKFFGAYSHWIGASQIPSLYTDGYLAEFNAINGQALTPSDFGNYNEDTGVWQPAKYSGTYGTNGFYLPFSDNTNTTTLAEDASGNGNDWTPNNISLTAGVTYDSMTDTPTPYADGGNYAVLNPLQKGSSLTVTNGNLDFSASGTASNVFATMPFTGGKFYFEVTFSTVTAASWGIATKDASITANIGAGGFANFWGFYCNPTANYIRSATNPWNNGTITTSSVGQIAVDATNPANVKMWIGVDNTWYNSSGGTTGNPATGSNATETLTNNVDFFPFFGAGNSSPAWSTNFGQRPFAYTPPTGFLPLHTGNLPDSAIVDGSEYFNTVLYTGNSTPAHGITGVGFQPDFVWIKKRSPAESHMTFNSVSGQYKYLQTDNTNLEDSAGSTLESFDADGFTVNDSSTVNGSATTYVAWNWKAGTAFSNDAGTNGATIASVGSVNQDAGFSIITHEAQAGTYSFYHGLGVAPSVFVFKNKDAASNWVWWQNDLATPPTTKFLYLNLPNGEGASGSNWLQSVTPNVIELTAGQVHGTSGTYLTYAFAEVEGYSKIGKWQNNNSTDGTFVYLGFRPRFILLKNYDNAESWYIWDSARQTYNVPPPSNNWLSPNLSNSEAANSATTAAIDGLSNGFKIRTTNPATGEISFGTRNYIYMAFAENPFKNSLAR